MKTICRMIEVDIDKKWIRIRRESQVYYRKYSIHIENILRSGNLGRKVDAFGETFFLQ